jgi:hypothetical protein
LASSPQPAVVGVFLAGGPVKTGSASRMMCWISCFSGEMYMGSGVVSFSDKVAGALITALIGFVVWLIQRRLEPSTRLRFWVPHDFLFQLPFAPGPLQPPAPDAQERGETQPEVPEQAVPHQPFVIRTNTLTVQNLGRKLADKVQIIHADRPDHFQMHPRRNYADECAPDGTHIITIDSLGPREVVHVQLLSYRHNPVLVGVRSKEGEAKPVGFQIQRVWPRWLIVLVLICMFVGAFAILYWLVLAVIFISRAIGLL